MLKLETPLESIRGIGPKFLRHLARMGIRTVKDLVFHFPFRYEDFSQIYRIEDLEPGQQATIQGVVEETNARRSWRRRMAIVEALIRDETGVIRAVWFNQPFVKNALRPGHLMNFAGKVSFSEGELYLSGPTYELAGRKETAHTGRLVPVYPETRGLTSKGLRYLIQPILKNIESLQEWLPEETRAEQSIPEINSALRAIHFPDRIEEAACARERFSFEDLFLLHLANLEQKNSFAKEKAAPIQTDMSRLKRILTALPFELTASQKKSLGEIIEDLARPAPMNRLLQGDVGSGKTVVAALAAFSAAAEGRATAFMAPTEVLARQHFESVKKILARIPEAALGFSPQVGILAAGGARLFLGDNLESDVPKKTFLEKAARGEIAIVIGTHALIEDSVNLAKLGLVIVDEQHRFGVRQRAKLLRKMDKSTKTIPHLLSMSATPIPRTLMLTIFGDLDVSTIDELPSGRKAIITKIVSPENRSRAYEFIRKEIRAGRQAFVICPRIEKDEAVPDEQQFKKLELKSVKEEFEKLSRSVFPNLKVAMLHGQMKPKEKEQVMRNFKDRKHDLLVATSVIEVGVDVPNATVMMIEGSERFGLAQLYQFRGRVGRGEHQSYCFLFTDSASKSVAERLAAILEAKNGFELAEKDLELRGPGQFLGTEQTGLPDLAMRGLQDIALIKTSRVAAENIIARDPALARYPLLKQNLLRFKRSIHFE